MDENTTKVEMSQEEMAEWQAFQQERQRKKDEKKRKSDREAYAKLVDETIAMSIPMLKDVSANISEVKAAVMGQFRSALQLKGEIFGTKDGQRSHTFTNSEGNMRITLGYRHTDDYRDTVEEGIAKVKQAIESLAKDNDSRALVEAVLRLLSRDKKGTIKASRVLQLRKLAEDSHNEDLIDGVKIIEESYQPTMSKQFITAEVKDSNNEWRNIPLGMTEA